jgi:hypothetical protein
VVSRGAARAALLVLLVLWPISEVASSTVRPLNIEELTARAAQIFVGRCIAVELARDEQLGLPVTVATFEVSVALKGAAGRIVTVRQLPAVDGVAAGSAGIAGLPAPRPGDEVVLFLYGATATRLTAPVGFGQGAFTVVADKNGRPLALNGFGNRHLFRGLDAATRRQLGLTDAEGADPGALPLERLAGMVRTLVAAGPPAHGSASGEGR